MLSPPKAVAGAVLLTVAAASLAGLAGSGASTSAGPPSTTVFSGSTAPPVSGLPPATPTTPASGSTTTSTTQARSTTLIPIPAGCDSPAPAQVVFVGQLVDVGERDGMARFELRQIRDGETGGRERSNLLDIRYGDDIRFLDVGNQYLVGAGLDEEGNLMSKAREEEPLFGGNDIVDVGETDVDCPLLEDPVRTLTVTGRDVETGVLSPLTRSSNRLLRAILLPAAVGVGAIVALAAVRWILTGLFRGAGAAVGVSRATTRRTRWR